MSCTCEVSNNGSHGIIINDSQPTRTGVSCDSHRLNWREKIDGQQSLGGSELTPYSRTEDAASRLLPQIFSNKPISMCPAVDLSFPKENGRAVLGPASASTHPVEARMLTRVEDPDVTHYY